jgi:hypothetical protein
MRATCPAGTIGTAGLTAALEGGGAGGSATGCEAGGASCNGFGFADGGGASTPEDAPGGIRFWLPPIAPGGRGTSLKPGGIDVWAEAEQAKPSANAIVARSRQRSARSDGKLMLSVYRRKSGEFKPRRLFVYARAPCYAQLRTLEPACPKPSTC